MEKPRFRVPFLAATGLALVACGGGAQKQQSAPSRVEAIASEGESRLTQSFCDTHPESAKAPPFTLPPLDGASMPDDPGWTWVSFWATWCAPCIAEMPMMKQWEQRLGQEGLPVVIRFVSVDSSQEDITRFKASHANAPETLRLLKQESLAAWLPSMGLDPAGSIPLHLFVDEQNRVRCARQGAISASDYGAVKAVLKGL